jgi:DDE superfamily endonuclease
MQNINSSHKRLVDFRLEVYASFTFRAAALFEVLDALLLSPMIRSAAEVSQSPLFRRRFASVYDALTEGKIDPTRLRQAVIAAEPAEALTVAGYAVYALDTTVALRPDAVTVPDRSKVYSAAHGKAIAGHQFSWLGRVIAFGHSWFAPREVQRVPTTSTPGEVGAEQVQRLGADPTPNQPKVVVVDSHFPVPPFLRAFVGRAPDLVLVVRLASNRILYGAPPPHSGKPGRPRAHGAKLALRAPGPPQRQETVRLLGQRVPSGCRLSAWSNQHFRAVPALVGLVVRAEFLRADGTPRYKRPLWLFWSGPQEIALADVVTIYLLRFAIEHFFRFLKQRLGLLVAHLGDLAPIETWVQLVALAYGQLLLSRDLVKPTYRPWDPTARQDPNRPLTPGQVLAAWQTFSRTLETPAAAPRRAGKAPGRAPGDRPRPRERYPVAQARKWKVKTAA